jgi:formiminotetrahydrofolate cyclodeaminase
VPLADRTLAEVVALLAAREPAPGGGSAAALTAALAAALTEMAAAYAPSSEAEGGAEAQARSREIRIQAAELRAGLLELAEDDMSSYGPVLDALALETSDPAREARVRAALELAAEVPLAIAASAAEVGELAAAAVEAGPAQLVGDATAAAVLAEAATRAAARLVELNLADSPRDRRLGAAEQLAQRAWAARTAALGYGWLAK